MQEVRVFTYCDYPDCAGEFKNSFPDKGQETSTTEFWVYVSGKGRKTNPIKIELCEGHKEFLREVFLTMQRHDQNKEH